MWDFGENLYEGGDEVTVRAFAVDSVDKATQLIGFGNTLTSFTLFYLTYLVLRVQCTCVISAMSERGGYGGTANYAYISLEYSAS